MNSLIHPGHGDKENSPWFEEFLARLPEDRDLSGMTGMIREVDTPMIAVEPCCPVACINELTLMTPSHYPATLESETHRTHVLRIGLNPADVICSRVEYDRRLLQAESTS